MNMLNIQKYGSYFRTAMGDSDAELEFIYGVNPVNNDLSKLDFMRLLNIFRQRYTSLEESNTLDINRQIVTLKKTYLSNIRCTIEGLLNIKKYCLENRIGAISKKRFIKKTDYKDAKIPDATYGSIFNNDYNFRMNMKREELLEEIYGSVIHLLTDFDESLKYFRYKKRFSFITDDKLFRIDLTAVKSNEYDKKKRAYEVFQSFQESNILKNKEKYELEIEYIGSQEIDGKCYLDDYIQKFHKDIEKEIKSSDENIHYKSNVHSELYHIEDQDIYSGMNKYDIDPDEDNGEFEMKDISDILFPDTFAPITSDPISDIYMRYWIESDLEWLYEALLKYNKQLLYNRIKKNTKGDYTNAPEHIDYVEFTISPDFTEEEIEEISDYPSDFKKTVMIPFHLIMNTSAIKEENMGEILPEESSKKIKPKWGPENIKPESKTAYRTKSKSFEKIEKIINKRKKEKGITIEYKVRWENEGESEDEWKTSGELPDAQSLIKEYNNSLMKPSSSMKYIPETIDPQMKADWMQEMGDYPIVKSNENKNKRTNNFIIENVIQSMNNLIQTSLKDIHNTEYLLTNRKKNEIKDLYHTLTEQNNYDKEKKESERINEELKTLFISKEKKYQSKIAELKSKRYKIMKKIKPTRFKGPQPVSMSLHCLLPSNPYTILKGYVVTEKADGIRAQLFISSKEGYLITGKMEVIDTNLRFENISGLWLFDGEYITKNKKGDDIQLFMIFDVYYAADSAPEGITYPNHAYSYPWLSNKGELSRSSILHDFRTNVSISSNDEKNKMRIDYKTYLEGPKTLKKDKKDETKYTNLTAMGKVSKKILDIEKKDGFEYNIDGLIYLPMHLPVNSMNEGENNKIGGTWNINYKWKPPEENTIDFKIKIVKNKNRDKITSITKDNEIIQCKEIELYVGYNLHDDMTHDFCWEILKNNKNYKDEILFMKDINIATTKIPLTNKKILCLKDKVEIQDDMIIEMRYQQDDEMKWIPLRHRKDKTTPQYFDTANNIWETIQEPVTVDMIKGKGLNKTIKTYTESIQEKEISYYVDKSNLIDIDEPLKKFHNYIKSKLIQSICSIGNKSISIMDTSIGKGGDISKYLRSRNRITFLLGLDISPDINKAAHRFYFENIKKPKAMFIQYDTGEIIKEGNGCKGKKEDIEKNNILLDIIYNKNKKIPIKYKEIHLKYKDLGNKGFDIISSQFSIHYYFKNELTLRNYIQNISDNCKPGGYFIGTCYDGKKVFQELLTNNKMEMIDDFGNEIYSINKEYEIEDFEYRKDDWSNMFGQEINVYMNSIGQKHIEYLVNFELLIDMMNEYGLKPVSLTLDKRHSGIFDNMNYTYMKGIGGFEQILKGLKNMNDPLLKKYYSEALEMLKEENKMLCELSSLNNWFIFQKNK